jgi:hypothetical protein
MVGVAMVVDMPLVVIGATLKEGVGIVVGINIDPDGSIYDKSSPNSNRTSFTSISSILEGADGRWGGGGGVFIRCDDGWVMFDKLYCK